MFPNADNETLASIARGVDLQIASGKLDTRERLIHFLAQMRQDARDEARLVEGLNYNPQGLRNTFDYFDAGLTDGATDSITRRVTRYTNSDNARKEIMRGLRDGGQFDGICRFSVARARFEDAE